MKIIKPNAEIITPLDGVAILKHIELCGRVCYQSEGAATPDSAPGFVAKLIKRGHESVLEHFSFTVRFTCDRAISHEIVRHRIASYSQESTRYCAYSKNKFAGEIQVIRPGFWEEGSYPFSAWLDSCQSAESVYLELLEAGASPQEARDVLPNSLKTTLIMTANLREWRHFFRLRTVPAAHPQMRELVIPLLMGLQSKLPIVFDDIVIVENTAGEVRAA